MMRQELIAHARALEEQVGRLAGQLAEAMEANEELVGRLGKVERLLGVTRKNSGFPGSGDDDQGVGDAAAGKRAVRRGKGRRRGGSGTSLAWAQEPDERVDVFPEGACGCGTGLEWAADLGVTASHQRIDIPLITASTIQYDRHTVRCGCGVVHQADAPPGVGAARTVCYGVNLQAWCVYLMVAHAIPVQRCQQIVAALTGAQPSAGWVHALLERAAVAVAAVNAAIKALIITAVWVACDETPLRVGAKGHKRYLLVAATTLYTWYQLGDRSLDTFKTFVLTELTGVVVHDRYALYDHPALGEHTHQLCCQHLLRDIEAAAEQYPDANWPIQTARALRGLIHQANLARDAGADAIDDQTRQALIDEFAAGVRVGLSEVPRVPGPEATTKQLPGRLLLLEVLRDRHDDVLRFAYDLRIPPTSNQAETDIRPSKIQQKISGRLTSQAATSNRYAIRGYISTAGKHAADVMTAIRDALLGHPWMPPAALAPG